MVKAVLSPVARAARHARAHARGFGAYLAGQAPRGEARVAYGLAVPRPGEPAVGGIVKLQTLAAVYPDEPRRFNVLYLVSSRLPHGAATLAEWAHRKGAHVVVNQNGVAYPAWHGPGWERVNAPMAALLARADYVLYQSAFCRESADRFLGAPTVPGEVLYNAVDTSRFAPRPAGGSGRALTLLLGGSQDQWYRVESAVRTLDHLVHAGVDAALIVTGRLGWAAPADAARQAAALVASLGLRERVEFTGPYTQEQAPALFNRAEILLHTKYNDPCPTVVIEAMASGCPVVYSSSGGVPELVGDDAGVGVGAERTWERDIPPDPGELAAAVLQVRADLDAYRAAARARAVARFDAGAWVARHRQIFDTLLTS